ncbi:hypothetical protein FRC19_006535 [Serendipita sp. 401]|nr:hypothetical protein FRC19_006535 [Serendipita sp. 401]KAG9058086.1 hypothetical protein FS842_001667 [Serendipita sp. 407]
MPDHGRVEAALDRSLNALGLEYIDLYLMHWPQADDPQTGRTLRPNESPTFVETWLEMEKLPLTGKTRSIGICNFSIKNLEILLSKANIVPAVHQIEIHPCLPNFELIQYSKANGIVVAGYTPMGKGSAPFYSDPTFLSLASKYEVQIGQILLSWAVQRGTIPIPKSSNEERARQNLQIIKLAQEDMNTIDEYHKQPGMHRSHSLIGSIKDEKLLGWTMDELGWPYDDDGYVKS